MLNYQIFNTSESEREKLESAVWSYKINHSPKDEATNYKYYFDI